MNPKIKILGASLLVCLIALGLKARSVTTLPVVHAQDGNASCSLASLNGAYALDRQGTLVSSLLGIPAPTSWGEVVIENFDGAGGFTGKATANVGGVVGSGTVSGTYTLNSDCTGTKTVNTSAGFTVHEAIIVIDGGRRMIGTQTDPWAVVQTRAGKISD